MKRTSTLDGNERLPLHPLRVFRVDPGRAAIVRITGSRYWGVFTHWTRGRSILCQGNDCPATVCKGQRFWRGYAAAEVWSQQQAHWLPVCLEITEHLELDFRGRFERGQVWEISRAPSVGKKHAPTCGELLESRDPKTFPAALDLLPCLLHLYHVASIDLEAKNPLPPRTMVGPSAGAPPAKLAGAIDDVGKVTPEVRELIDQAKKRFSVGTQLPELNGKAH